MHRRTDDVESTVWRRVRVDGIVQGVGFRPTVFRLARRHELVGEVRNTADGVELILGGRDGSVRKFLEALPNEVPAPGRIDSLEEQQAEPLDGCSAFTIAPSRGAETIEVVIPPDQATCAECLRELRNPADRRYAYPLITCTVCGPRHSIIEAVPYDRERTSMREFPLCDDCRTQYEDPDDRRFHAETIACPKCGPNLGLIAPEGPVECADPIEKTAEYLQAGRIVAIKGIGGYHLACDATNDHAVRELRRRKGRPHKPFAILVAGVEAARRLCEIDEAEGEALQSPEAPIVLLRRRPEARDGGTRFAGERSTGWKPVVPAVSPDNDRLGVMMPYTPIQHLLARRFTALVMTSGNVTDEPIRHTEKGVRDLLGGAEGRPADAIADFALIHPRRIVNPSDDSVVVVQCGAPALIRRARGHVPAPLTFDTDLPPILAVGADLKNACAFGLRRKVYFSPHIGDLEYPAAFRRHLEEIERFRKWFGKTPAAVACDLHPGYHSAQNAYELSRQYGVRLIEVQHHHAHIGACLAEHGLDEEIIGVAFDGTGYGTDGAVWGGEFLVASRAGFRRFGRFAYHALPGGEQAIHEPWRSLAACLVELFGAGRAREILERHVSPALDIEPTRRTLEGPIRPPVTSSVGRLFDAVGVLLGFPTEISYEAQNAIALESLCSPASAALQPSTFNFQLAPCDIRRHPASRRGPDDDPDLFEIDLKGLFEGILDDLEAGVRREETAERFHATIIEMIVQGCRRIRETTGLKRVGLSGGCFANTILVEGAAARLTAEGFDVLLRRRVPANDGGVAFGQLAVAAARIQSP